MRYLPHNSLLGDEWNHIKAKRQNAKRQSGLRATFAHVLLIPPSILLTPAIQHNTPYRIQYNIALTLLISITLYSNQTRNLKITNAPRSSLFSSLKAEHSLWQTAKKRHLMENKNKDSRARRAYDHRFGLILRPKPSVALYRAPRPTSFKRATLPTDLPFRTNFRISHTSHFLSAYPIITQLIQGNTTLKSNPTITSSL
jgi:hypothetical protein